MFEEISKDSMSYKRSGSGVTLTGGESSAQSESAKRASHSLSILEWVQIPVIPGYNNSVEKAEI